MSRISDRVIAVIAALTAVGVSTVLAGCLDGSTADPAPSVSRIGDPSATASPTDTTVPTPTPQAAVPTMGMLPPASPGTRRSIAPASAALAACLEGTWTAPISREFAALKLSERSHGAVRGGSGQLRFALSPDQTFTFAYDGVSLDLPVGRATVDGPVTGSWSLNGSTLNVEQVSRNISVKVGLGPVSVPAPSSVATALESLPPPDTTVTCTATQMTMQLPAEQGGGTVRFDRAV